MVLAFMSDQQSVDIEIDLFTLTPEETLPFDDS